ncbi:hypothetical protein MAL08_07550 [Leptospira noguchii]|uniref:hypothetical protein n=1 Tax=Leptospira noguchii TaxID=28182 RepID=UPI001FB85623|nr:hypothetical protein [Leptospira noguchii]UOG39121.1 hypothetical protein MAL08_07550 [Leptospira noguchii]
MIKIKRSILDFYKEHKVYINLILFCIIGIYFALSILAQSFQWNVEKVLKNDIFNFLSSFLTIIGSFAAALNTVELSATNRILKSILSNKIFDIVSHSPISINPTIDEYLNSGRYKKTANRLLNYFREPLLESKEDFEFDFQGVQKVLRSMKIETNLNDIDFNYICFQFYSDKYWFWDKFVEVVSEEILKNPELIKESIWKYLCTKEDLLLNEKESKVLEFIKESINSKENYLEKIIEADTTLTDSELFSHIMSGTYIQAEYSPDDDLKKHRGPVLLIKNEEKYSSWWRKIDDLVKDKLLKTKNLSEKEIETFETREDIKKKNKKILTQPFYTALKKSPIINNFLEFLNQSPVFYFDTRDVPSEYGNNPKRYIAKELKPIARRTHSDLVNYIKKEYKITNIPKKEIVMNYQLVPFNTEKMVVKVDSEDYPKPIQRLMISTMLSYDQKKKIIRSHIIETKKFIQEISPFSLASKSIGKNKIEELRKSENVILKELSLKKNGEIKFRGITNILGNEQNLNHILKLSHNKIKTLKLPISKTDLKKVYLEIFSNAKRISEKIS